VTEEINRLWRFNEGVDLSKPIAGFAGNVLKLTAGSTFAQVLGVLVAPIVTRLFAPEAFGVAALFASIAGTIRAISCLRYELSIMLPENDEEAANLLGVSICSAIIITCVTVLAIFGFQDSIVQLFNAPELKKYLWLLPLSVFLAGMVSALTYWNSRAKNFGRLSVVRVLSSGITQTSKLTSGFTGFVSGGALIVSTILGQLIASAFLGIQTIKTDWKLLIKKINFKRMNASASRYRKFPIFSTWSALINTASYQLPVWILAIYFSADVVGYYALGNLVLGIPMILIGSAVSQVFFQRAAEARNTTNDLPEIVQTILIRLVSLSIFPTLLLTIIGKDVFALTFGVEWAEAGMYVQILCIWVFFQFISSPLSTIFGVLEKQESYLMFDILIFATRSIALVAGGLTGNVLITLALFSLASVSCYGFLCFWILLNTNVSMKVTLMRVFKYLLYSAPLIGIVAAAKFFFHIGSLYILLLSLLGTITYYAVVVSEDKTLHRIFGFCK